MFRWPMRWIGAALLGASMQATCAEQVYTSLLLGDRVVPPNGSDAAAFVKLTLSDDLAAVRISYGYGALDPTDVTAVHVHAAPAGSTGAVVVDVGAAASPRLNVVAPVPAGQLDDLLAGDWYVDFHTNAFPDGEIRGQLAPSSHVAIARLNGLEQVPPNGSPASGVARIDFPVSGTGIGFASARVHGLTTPLAAAHLHGRAFPLQDASVLADLGAALAPGTTGDAEVRFDAAQSVDFNAGLMYFDVHTGAFAGGELRGLLVPQGGVAYVARLDGAQAVPPTASAATGESVLLLYPLANNAKLSVRFDGLSSGNTGGGVYVGQAGTSGALHVPFAASGTTSGLVVGQNVGTDLPGPMDLDAFLARSGVYVSVGSQNAAEEIRGVFRPLDFVHADGFEQ